MKLYIDLLLDWIAKAVQVLTTGKLAIGAWSICIVMDRAGVKSMRGIPLSQQSNIRNFLEKDLGIQRPFRILGARSKSGRLRIRVLGDIDNGTVQRIRNYFLSVL